MMMYASSTGNKYKVYPVRPPPTPAPSPTPMPTCALTSEQRISLFLSRMDWNEVYAQLLIKYGSVETSEVTLDFLKKLVDSMPAMMLLESMINAVKAMRAPLTVDQFCKSIVGSVNMPGFQVDELMSSCLDNATPDIVSTAIKTNSLEYKARCEMIAEVVALHGFPSAGLNIIFVFDVLKKKCEEIPIEQFFKSKSFEFLKKYVGPCSASTTVSSLLVRFDSSNLKPLDRTVFAVRPISFDAYNRSPDISSNRKCF